ncbi:MAG: hypothetical protein AABY11_01920, partial [archaeon]
TIATFVIQPLSAVFGTLFNQFIPKNGGFGSTSTPYASSTGFENPYTAPEPVREEPPSPAVPQTPMYTPVDAPAPTPPQP